MQDRPLVMLAGPSQSTSIIFNALNRNGFFLAKVILEEKVPVRVFLQRRIQKQGIVRVIGQVLFRVILVPVLTMTSRPRIRNLKSSLGLDDTPIDESKIIRVRSANSPETIKLLQSLNPAAVVVNGTRILSREVIHCIQTRFINLHTGITPFYRGVHGAYWALVEGRRDRCGVTVHVVDDGIDTGQILSQALIHPAADDNLVTYQYLQWAAGIPLLMESLQGGFSGPALGKSAPEGISKLWSHPSAWGYLWHRIRRRGK